MNPYPHLFTALVAILIASQPARGELTEQQKQWIAAAAPAHASTPAKQHRKVLVWNTPFIEASPHKGFSIPQGEYAMVTLGRKTGAFEPVVSDDVASYLPDNLKQFDAIIFNNSSGDWIRPADSDLPRLLEYGRDIDTLEELLKQSLLNWIANGGGIVAYHHAVGGNPGWPEFKNVIGAGYWGHPWNEEVGVALEEPNHTLLSAFGGKAFRISEEVFQYREPYSRNTLRVLLSLDIPNTDMTRPWIYREDDDFALAWIHRYGRGRVFYCAFGHKSETWWNPAMLRFYLDGIQYALGDLPADDTPSAYVGTEEGFKCLFDGRTLKGWRGNPRIWSVEDGAITGRTTPENRIAENDFLIWTGGEVRDFELRLKYRLINGNSGVYFRAKERTSARAEALVGIQADLSADHRWTGVLYEFTRRGFIAGRGQKTVMENGGVMKVVGQVGDPQELLRHVHDRDWNDVTVIAQDNRLELKLNDVVMCEAIDDDPWRIREGKLALQVHRGEDMLVQFKDIRIRHY